jgi:hypothetical protein
LVFIVVPREAVVRKLLETCSARADFSNRTTRRGIL